VDRRSLAERIVCGTPEACAERIAAYRSDEVVVALLLRDDAEMLELFATGVAPLLR
jgi:alkanesulfonate monooxygenase SsuD/methylene tetrahydromethanopterin reductase-like flavin-dependent oxidoreductase (luciferase family)